MTFSTRIRTFLILVAVVPTVLVMSVIYIMGERHAAGADNQTARRSLDRFTQYRRSVESELAATSREVAGSSVIRQASLLLDAGRAADVRLEAAPAGLDFLEIIDDSYTVLASRHRPGLVGERLNQLERTLDDSGFVQSVEYDVSGPHAALACVVPAGERYLLYAGRYLDRRFTGTVERLIGATVSVFLADEATDVVRSMTVGQLYREGDSLQAVLLGGPEAGYFVAASFNPGPERSVFNNLLGITGLVALGSIALAITLGMTIASRAKREFDNLITATGRVASGDFSTPVMAYDEGEFAQLADSFTEMTFRLKDVQRRLATTEKIAAWQAVGRKIAHEVKNPLTPISISTDDLRRSYHEQLADFPRILDETTGTIKSEVSRLTKMLDEFVRFARMAPPVFEEVLPETLIDSIVSLYRSEMESGRLTLENKSAHRKVQLDPGGIQQVLVNLIKNSFEAAPGSCVTVGIADDADNLVITVSDTGPGFPSEIIQRGFEPYVSTKKGGSGLGLVISQRIVHDHGGTIEIRNRLDGGAAVTIKLPVHHG